MGGNAGENIGGGSNILRGGKRAYNCKTLVGNFVEETYRPNAVKEKWPGGSRYETTAQHQMLEGAGVQMTRYGAGLKKPEDPRFDYNQLIGANRLYSDLNWKSLAHSAHSLSKEPTEFAAPRERPLCNMNESELQQYRHRWTKDTNDLKVVRYVTESSATQQSATSSRFWKPLTGSSPPSFT